jgi:hypothetical protein
VALLRAKRLGTDYLVFIQIPNFTNFSWTGRDGSSGGWGKEGEGLVTEELK